MRRGSSMLAGLALVLALVLLAAGTATGAEAWRRFVHPSQGFALSYPAEWEVVSSRQGTIGLAVVGPEIAAANGFRLSVNVASEPVPQDVTVDHLEALTESKVALLLNGYQQLRTDRTRIAGRPAVLRYYTWKRNDGVGLYQMQLYTIAGRRAFVLTGTTVTTSPTLPQDIALLLRIMLTFTPKR